MPGTSVSFDDIHLWPSSLHQCPEFRTFFCQDINIPPYLTPALSSDTMLQPIPHAPRVSGLYYSSVCFAFMSRLIGIICYWLTGGHRGLCHCQDDWTGCFRHCAAGPEEDRRATVRHEGATLFSAQLFIFFWVFCFVLVWCDKGVDKDQYWLAAAKESHPHWTTCVGHYHPPIHCKTVLCVSGQTNTAILIAIFSFP